jgi:ubiquinone/menaquinone biosynthesis C-methylase UbiE
MVRSYYRGEHARDYERRWRRFNQRTLAQAFALLERMWPSIVQGDRRLRVLDVACGTGRLLKQIVARFPHVEAVGVDASSDMLAQARQTLEGEPRVRLEVAQVGRGKRADLPFEAGAFDVITCTNALHALPQPLHTLEGLKELLSPGGLLVLEDYARRPFPFPWPLFEPLLRLVEGTYARAHTLAEARALCTQAGFQVVVEESFAVDWLWHGWAIAAKRP